MSRARRHAPAALAPPAIAALVLGGCYLSSAPEGPRPGDAGVDARVDAPDAFVPPPPPPPPDPVDPGDVRDACEVGEREALEVLLELPGNAGLRRCPWGEGDNLGPAQERATARIEDTTGPALPEGVVLCDLALDFRVEASFRYDDNFVLLFGDSVLAASDRSLVERLPRSGLVRRWDWSRVAGAPMLVSGSDPYCVGADEGLAECTLPASDLSDRLALAFDPALVDELSFRAFEAGRADFTMIAIGDNDPATDCRYGELGVEVGAEFVRTE